MPANGETEFTRLLALPSAQKLEHLRNCLEAVYRACEAGLAEGKGPSRDIVATEKQLSTITYAIKKAVRICYEGAYRWEKE